MIGPQSHMAIEDGTANILSTTRQGLESKPNTLHIPQHIIGASCCKCDSLIVVLELQNNELLKGWTFDSPMLAPFSEDNSNTFKVGMCIPELKRANSTIPLECIRDSSTLACFKNLTSALSSVRPMWKTHSH